MEKHFFDLCGILVRFFFAKNTHRGVISGVECDGVISGIETPSVYAIKIKQKIIKLEHQVDLSSLLRIFRPKWIWYS